MAIEWPAFLYGGDYNPEQWPREVWDEDVRLMQRAGWNIATLPVFGWASLEPTEGSYDFEWLDDIIGRLHAGGIRICLATATASVPAWLTQAYPDVLVVNEHGVRAKHGNRHTFCPHSPNYIRKSQELVRQLKERYGKHPALALWHVNNEYGTYCYCEKCAAAFRVWLQERYGSLDALNAAWYTSFWGHNLTDWEQIDTPTSNGEGSIQAFRLDYRRFMSNAILNLFRGERDILRDPERDVPVTTNLMGAFFPLDYHQWGKELDVVSWDNYPTARAKPATVAFYHSLMRGAKQGQPFLLMEQSPSQQNWQRYNTVKRPGNLRLQSFQTVAQGADSVMYFQWRRGRGGIEKLHGAVVEHGGDENNRVFQDVATIGKELAKLGTRIQNARVDAKAAVLFDWPNWWALQLSSGPNGDLNYPEMVRQYFEALHHLGIDADVLSPSADLSGYSLIIAPTLTMLREEDAANIESAVENGATLVATAFTGLTNETDIVYLQGAPGPWRKLLGIWVEETDAREPGFENTVVWPGGFECKATIICDRIHLEGAEKVAYYGHDFYADEPAITRHGFGSGTAYYVATHLDPDGIRHVVASICDHIGLSSPLGYVPEGLEVTVRVREDGERQLYVLNHSEAAHECVVPFGTAIDLITDEPFVGSFGIAPGEVRILVSG